MLDSELAVSLRNVLMIFTDGSTTLADHRLCESPERTEAATIQIQCKKEVLRHLEKEEMHTLEATCDIYIMYVPSK